MTEEITYFAIRPPAHNHAGNKDRLDDTEGDQRRKVK